MKVWSPIYNFKRKRFLLSLNISTWLLIFLLLCACGTKEKKPALFTEVESTASGISFANIVKQEGDNNVLSYPYYFNGGGVAIGDINNDGLEDIYFTGNQLPDKLYLNKGDFEFEDITLAAGVEVTEGWKTGVALADVNLDGWLDIYVCRSGMADSTLRKNLLFVNNGDLTFTEQADKYGVGDNSYSTQAAFFDYDKDGDPDLFVLNHSLPQYAGFNNMLVNNKKRRGKKFHSKLYKNNNGKFSDVSDASGIVNNVLSFGLGIGVSDLNMDGWPDIYISNDFNEEDYLYYNNRDGTFTNAIRDATGHVSLFSMGSDIADVNNDGLPDIFTLDMLPETNERIKLSSGDDNYDKYRILIKSGFHHQSMRNMLQLNNGNETFSEVGQMMGISNTDWSWASLFSDFDGDGWKDLFVSNGYEKDYTNMQFLKFTVDEKIKARTTGTGLDYQQIINQMPSIQVGNFLFRNNGNLTFSKTTEEWGITRLFKSNGAAYGDLDNDGDPDLVINAMNEKAVVYRNEGATRANAHYMKVDLRRNNPGVSITGTKVILYDSGRQQYQEFSPVRGFQSAMYVPLIFGTGGKSIVDSLRIIWPDNRSQLMERVPAGNTLTPAYRETDEIYYYPERPQVLFRKDSLLAWAHKPVDTVDFKRQLLLPKIYSYSGGRMAKADVNGDGQDDLYLCGAKDQPGALFLQHGGKFMKAEVADFGIDKGHQDEDAIFFDADGDADADLYVVSGGYLFGKDDKMLQDRLYINDGKGRFRRDRAAVPSETHAGACVAVLDIDYDQDLDLFVGSRLVPSEYPISPVNMFLINDGTGKFTEAGEAIAPGLNNAGMICDATTADVNGDGKADLITAGEWTSIKVFISHDGTLADESDQWVPPDRHGWWNRLVADDFDGDGDIDLVAGNYGLNTQFKVSPSHPATLVYKDFDHDGQVDPFFSYYIQGTSYPYASRDEALGQVSMLKPRFPDYVSYSNVTLDKIFTVDELRDAKTLKAEMLETIYLENRGTHFTTKTLPAQAQFSPVYAIASFDVDHDGDKDLVMGGNDTYNRVRIGKADANKGFVFLNNGKGEFTYLSQRQSGLNLSGDVRDINVVRMGDEDIILFSAIGKPVTSYHITTDVE